MTIRSRLRYTKWLDRPASTPPLSFHPLRHRHQAQTTKPILKHPLNPQTSNSIPQKPSHITQLHHTRPSPPPRPLSRLPFLPVPVPVPGPGRPAGPFKISRLVCTSRHRIALGMVSSQAMLRSSTWSPICAKNQLSPPIQ